MKGEGKGVGQGGGKPRKTRPRGLRGGGLGFCVSYSLWVGWVIYIHLSAHVYVANCQTKCNALSKCTS